EPLRLRSYGLVRRFSTRQDGSPWRRIAWKVGIEPHFLAMRLAGITALFVASAGLLEAERSLTAHRAGVLALALAAAMLAGHVALMRASPGGRPSAEARLAALFGTALLVPGMVLLFWQRPGLDATVLVVFEVSN